LRLTVCNIHIADAQVVVCDRIVQLDGLKQRLQLLETLQRDEGARINRLNTEFRRALLMYQQSVQQQRSRRAAASTAQAQAALTATAKQKADIDQQLKAVNDQLAATGSGSSAGGAPAAAAAPAAGAAPAPAPVAAGAAPPADAAAPVDPAAVPQA